MKILLAALTALGVTAAVVTGTDGRDPAPEGAQELPVLEIEIIPDADSVRADPDSVYALPGQTVRWTSELGDWTVKFKSGVPFGASAAVEGIMGDRGQGRGREVHSDATPGRYKYDIMVRVQGGRNLRADPEVVIGPGDGPEH